MGNPTSFLHIPRHNAPERSIDERTRDWREVGLRLPVIEAQSQASRCMDCGVPFCHSQAAPGGGGCPLGNVIPEFNDHVYRGQLEEAAKVLGRTNNFPELTGRICPAPCEKACVLELAGAPVAIESIERFIADETFARAGQFIPEMASQRTGKRVAIVGSGPAGLAAAQELARLGHEVEVLERQDRIGGLLRYGIPDFKLDKVWIDRRLDQMRAEGVRFRTNVALGKDVSLDELTTRFDAVILAMGASRPRDTKRDGQLLEGRQLAGIHFAMEFLESANRAVAEGGRPTFSAEGKRVVVLGGGDTGSDCVGTALRQGAKSIVNIELFPAPPETRSPKTPWPAWPSQLRTSSSHEEAAHVSGADVRHFARETIRFLGNNLGAVTSIEASPTTWKDGLLGCDESVVERFDADLVLLAMGFEGVDAEGAEVALDARGNLAATEGSYQTSAPKVFACGDARRGQSLVVWAIAEGRACSMAVHQMLGNSA